MPTHKPAAAPSPAIGAGKSGNEINLDQAEYTSGSAATSWQRHATDAEMLRIEGLDEEILRLRTRSAQLSRARYAVVNRIYARISRGRRLVASNG